MSAKGIEARQSDVRFTPESGHLPDAVWDVRFGPLTDMLAQ